MDSLYFRYANALIILAKDDQEVIYFKDVLKEYLSFFNENQDIKNYLESYFVKNEEKYAILDQLLSQRSENLLNFYKVLVKNHRFYELDKITHEYIKLANERVGILEGNVYSVTPLEKDKILRIEEALSKKMNAKVELTNHIDESILGGVKVVIHDHVYDGSLLGKVESMKENLLERRK